MKLNKFRNHFWYACMLLLLIGSMTACKKEDETAGTKGAATPTPAPTATSLPTPTNTPTPIPTPTAAPKLGIPKHVLDLYETFGDLEEEYEFSYRTRREPYFEKSWLNDALPDYYIFYLYNKEGYESVSFQFEVLKGTLETERSFLMLFNYDDFYNTFYWEVVLDTFIAVDDTLDFETAKKLRDDLFLSFLTNEPMVSEIVHLRDYEVLMDKSKDLGLGEYVYVYVKHKEEKNLPVDTKQYKNYPAEALKSIYYNSTKVYFTGEVKKINSLSQKGIYYPEDDYMAEVEGSDGELYEVDYYLSDTFYHLEPGKKYLFYGTVDNLKGAVHPGIHLDYYEVIGVPTPTVTPRPTRIPTPIPESGIPEHVRSLYKKYRELGKQYDFAYRKDDAPYFSSFADDNYLYCKFDFKGKKENIWVYFTFEGLKEPRKIERSFRFTSFSFDDFNTKTYQDIVTATFLALDSKLSLEQAKELREQLFHSFLTNGQTVSDILEVGEYKAIIEIVFDSDSYIHFKHKEEINVPVDTSKYKRYSPEQMKLKENHFAEIYLSGEVTEIRQEEMYYVAKIKADDGEMYDILYYLSDTFCHLEPGKKYNFYGVIVTEAYSGNPTMGIDYYEIIE